MKKRGFTLIELLAVIVILAIIALIATPIVMNVIENSRKGAAERSAGNYLNAVETAVAAERIDNKVLEGTYDIQDDGSICPVAGCGANDADKVKIDMSGNKPSNGTIKITNGLVTTESTMIIGDYTVSYDETKETYIATKGKIVYRFSTETIGIGTTIEDPSIYPTDSSELEKEVYLKHILDEDNKVTESYMCAIYNNEEICLRGGNAAFYGYAANPEDYTGTVLILEGLNCAIGESNSSCSDGTVGVYATSTGNVRANDGNYSCYVNGVGNSSCGNV